jgi:predicted membrane channel-forming protein YqfA (hemolysin III family)
MITKADNSVIKNQLKVNKTIFFSLAAGLISFSIVALVFIQDKDSSVGKDLDNIFTIVVPVIGLMMMFLSRMTYNQLISKNDASHNLTQKISHYRTAKIISWAMIESACLLALVATMLTSNYLYVAVFIFLFGYFFLLKPSKESLIQDMSLNSEESNLVLKS